MNNTTAFNIDDETIQKVGLTPSDVPLNAQVAPDARIFSYPDLPDVYIMESDLYGNPMPQGSCFLAFKGKYGFVGQHMTIEVLRKSNKETIKQLISANAGSSDE